MRFPSFKNEIECLKEGYHFVIGCDEVGVSPLAGPVVAAACILNPDSIGKYRSKKKWYYRVRDSKTTNEKEREVLVKEILENTLHYGVGVVWPEDIDRLNIHKASLEAMRLATEELLSKAGSRKRTIIFLDGRFRIPNLRIDQRNLIKGDTKILSISAASIIAKVHRDNIMKELDSRFPNYGFAKHKGYGTKEHHDALKKLGMASCHRKSFFTKGWLRDLAGHKEMAMGQ
jgi:ribonuclease HII